MYHIVGNSSRSPLHSSDLRWQRKHLVFVRLETAYFAARKHRHLCCNMIAVISSMFAVCYSYGHLRRAMRQVERHARRAWQEIDAMEYRDVPPPAESLSVTCPLCMKTLEKNESTVLLDFVSEKTKLGPKDDDEEKMKQLKLYRRQQNKTRLERRLKARNKNA